MHLIDSVDIYSLSDLHLVKQGNLLPKFTKYLRACINHITKECEVLTLFEFSFKFKLDMSRKRILL